jgi:roadblock/LC7 domain-containing protein
MTDIFENTVLCKDCKKAMKKARVVKNGFQMRALICDNCKNKIIHPADKAAYNDFLSIKDKTFKVKLRLVGNSYAVSIPKEIVQFIKEAEKEFDNMVKLAFEDANKLRLVFD